MAKTRRSMGNRKRKEQNKKYMENKRSIVRNSSRQKPSELNQDANQTPLVSSVSEASQNAKDLSTSSSKVGVTPQDLNPDANQTPLIPSVSETSPMGKDSTPPSDAAAETNSILPENILHDYALHDLDPKEVLTGELSVQMMDYVSQLFKEQFKITDGMLPPSYMYGLECSKDKKPSFKFNMNKHIVQIHLINDPIRHFVVSSQENCHLVIYDSLFNIGRINDLKAQMNILYDNLDERNVKYVVPQSQGSTNLCGFFAIANAYMLLSRTEPGYRQYITSKMRQHLEQCIQKREITSFPSSVTFKRKRSMDPQHDTAQNKKQKICPMEYKRQSRQNIELSNKGKSRDNACKQDARKTAEFREKERTRNRERKMRQRQNVEYKQKETEYDRQQKVKKRQNVECKQKETEYNRQLKIKQRQNVDFSQKETEYDRQQKVKKRQNVECKQKETEYNRELKVKQRQNVEFSQKETEYDRQQKVKKRQNVECKQKETEYNRQLKVKQRQNVEFSQKETEYDRQQKVKKRQNVEYKQKETEYDRQQKVKKRQNVECKQKETEYNRQLKVKQRQNVEFSQKETEYDRQQKVKKRQNVEFKQKETEYDRQQKVKKRQNIEFKQKETEYDRQQKVKQRQNVEFKKKEKELKICERQNHQFKQKERSQQKHKKQLCRKDEEFRKTENLKNKQKKSQNKLQHRQTISIIENCIKEFREECSKIPCSICSVCYKYLFRKQVVKLVLAKYPDEQQVLDCIAKNNFHQEKTTCLPDCKNCAKWICVTCQRHLSKGTIPNQAAINNLALDEQPECLRKLNQLERHLISPVIPFMKILNLPKSLQKGIHGPVICVPSNIPNVTQTLPRTVSDHTIIKVKLKRKLEYRGHHLYQQVSLTNLQEALQELKDHNPHFTGINVNFDNFTEDEECSSLVNSIDTDIDDHVDQSKVLQPKNNQCGIDEEENSTIQPSICVTDKETDVLNALDITGSSTIPSNDNKKEHEVRDTEKELMIRLKSALNDNPAKSDIDQQTPKLLSSIETHDINNATNQNVDKFDKNDANVIQVSGNPVQGNDQETQQQLTERENDTTSKSKSSTETDIKNASNQKPKTESERQDTIINLLTGKFEKALDNILNGINKVEMPVDQFVEVGFWDFAGEKDYYATHEIFLHRYALYVLVEDINGDIKQVEAGGSFNSIGDYIDFWFDNIHCQGMPTKDETKLDPPVIVVGTGTDKCKSEEKLSDQKDKFRKQLLLVLGSDEKRHLRQLCFVSNTEPTDKEFDELRSAILEHGQFLHTFAERLPLRWIKLERLLDVMRNAGCNILSKEKVIKLSIKCGIRDENETLTFLRYQHSIGGLIFFDTIPLYIILKHTWLANAFRCLVSDKVHSNVKLTPEWEKLEDTGKLEHSLIEMLFDKEPELKFKEYQGHILSIMEMFDTIVKPRDITSSYYMPCMIREHTSLSEIYDMFETNQKKRKRTPWLCIEFKHMPLSFFNHILFHYIRKYDLYPKPSNNLHAIYHSIAVFYLEQVKFTKLLVCFFKNTVAIQILYWPELARGICKSIRLDLQELIAKLKERYEAKQIHYEVKTECGMCDIQKHAGRRTYKDLRAKVRVCEEHDEEDNEPNKSSQMYETWFDDFSEDKDVERRKDIKDTEFGRCIKCNTEPSVYWCYECDAALCWKCHIDHLKSTKHHAQHVQDKYTFDYTFNVNVNEIVDIKLVSDGLLCVADLYNKQLVTVDITSRKQQSISLPSNPLRITVVDNSTVAVTLANNKVVMVDIRQGHIIKQIDVKQQCVGIMYSNNQLFVGCMNKTINVISTSGKITNTIQLSFIPRYMCCSDDGSIYCTDWSKLYCIDTEGSILFTFTHPDMDIPWSITTDDTGHVLVVCHRSNNILSFSPDGKQCQIIVKHIPDISRYPPLICYIPQSKSLVVGRYKKIDVYKPC